MTIDMSLKNDELYRHCTTETVAGRLNLITPVETAITMVGTNVANMTIDPQEVILTGPMAVWSYLVVFHAIVHKTRRVYYDDGRNGKVLIAAHG